MIKSLYYVLQYQGGGHIDEWDNYVMDKTNGIDPLQLLLYTNQIYCTKEFAKQILPHIPDHEPPHFDDTKSKEQNLMM